MPTHLRNGILVSVFVLTWTYFYVPNPYVSFLGVDNQSEPVSSDLLFLWLPIILSVVAYIAHAGRWFTRLGLALLPPIFLLGAVFGLGVTGLMSKEGAGWTLMTLAFPLRAFVVALAATTLIAEAVRRLRKGEQSKGTSAT